MTPEQLQAQVVALGAALEATQATLAATEATLDSARAMLASIATFAESLTPEHVEPPVISDDPAICEHGGGVFDLPGGVKMCKTCGLTRTPGGDWS